MANFMLGIHWLCYSQMTNLNNFSWEMIVYIHCMHYDCTEHNPLLLVYCTSDIGCSLVFHFLYIAILSSLTEAV